MEKAEDIKVTGDVEPKPDVEIDPKTGEKKWIPLESNPQTFTDYAHELGYPELFTFQEVFSLDPEMWGFLP